ncbi:MAG: hypothetical protein QGG40_08385 [Myxococcota bacterium]|jgi:hypothetical protein|nr:hypothetical protein [Myxococcota bacterium]
MGREEERTDRRWMMIGWLVLGLLGCGSQEQSDGNAAACEKLCEKVSGCVEKASDTAVLVGGQGPGHRVHGWVHRGVGPSW